MKKLIAVCLLLVCSSVTNATDSVSVLLEDLTNRNLSYMSKYNRTTKQLKIHTVGVHQLSVPFNLCTYINHRYSGLNVEVMFWEDGKEPVRVDC